MPRPVRPAPREIVTDWPNEVSADAVGEVARQIAVNIRRAMNGRSLRAAQEVTGVHHSTIQAVLDGRAWPDAYTLAKLELGFGEAIWPQ